MKESEAWKFSKRTHEALNYGYGEINKLKDRIWLLNRSD